MWFATLVLLLGGCNLWFPLDAAPDAAPIPDTLTPGTACDPEDVDLIACYDLDDSTVDGSARQNDMDALDVEFVLGVDGGALAVTASSSVVTMMPALNATTGVTIEAWVKPANTGTEQYVFDHDVVFGLSIDVAGGVKCHTAGGSLASTPPHVIAFDEWSHVACALGLRNVSDANVIIFVHGQAIPGQGVVSGFTPDRNTIAAIAADVGGAASRLPFTGAIDRLRLWNRTRTSDEVLAEAQR